jgi:glucokinase
MDREAIAMGAKPRSVIALDVGGTGIKGLVQTADGTELASCARPTPVAQGVEAVLAAIIDSVRALRAEAADRADAVAVGLICPGHVDAVNGIALYSVNIGWRDVPLAELVSRQIGLPVSIEHDVRAAGVAEASRGAARGVAEALYVQIGTGIAGAVITSSAVLPGVAGLAGEIGHIPVVPDGEYCACGQRGCTETYASASALARRYRSAAATPDPISAREVLARIDQDPIARTVFECAVTALGRALVIYTLLMDPELIVVGGGLSLAGQALLSPLAAQLAAGLAWREAPRLVVGEFGADAGRIGAAILAWRGVGASA